VTIIQKVSPSGSLLWGSSGITLSGSQQYTWPQLLPVGSDDVILKYFLDSGTFPALTRTYMPSVTMPQAMQSGLLLWL